MPTNTSTQGPRVDGETEEELRDYVCSLAQQAMNFLHTTMTSDYGSADPRVGAAAAAYLTLSLVDAVEDAKEKRNTLITLINALHNALGPVGEDVDNALVDGQFAMSSPSTRVH